MYWHINYTVYTTPQKNYISIYLLSHTVIVIQKTDLERLLLLFVQTMHVPKYYDLQRIRNHFFFCSNVSESLKKLTYMTH